MLAVSYGEISCAALHRGVTARRPVHYTVEVYKLPMACISCYGSLCGVLLHRTPWCVYTLVPFIYTAPRCGTHTHALGILCVSYTVFHAARTAQSPVCLPVHTVRVDGCVNCTAQHACALTGCTTKPTNAFLSSPGLSGVPPPPPRVNFTTNETAARVRASRVCVSRLLKAMWSGIVQVASYGSVADAGI